MRTLPETSPAILPAAARAEAGARPWWPTLAALGVFWLLVLNQQRLEWAVNPVYSYGWAVPLLAGYLFWSRWTDRPAPGPALGFGWFAAGTALLLAAYLPVRVVQEANPDWVKINWTLAALWLGLALLALARIGGAPYARHFLFPLVFCFTALPWPVWVEESLSQNLMSVNAAASAEVMTLLGTPALAQGNLVQVADRWVNVEEACSGIRSLQTAFMMALFLGEFYRLGAGRRIALLAASFAVAFVVNLARTIVLTRLARNDAVDEWHDTVGTIAMAACLVALWLLAESVRPRRGRAEPPRAASAAALAAPFSWKAAGLVALWLCVAEGLTHGWYYRHERTLPPPLAWELRWPREAPGFAEGKFAERMSALLKFNHGATAGWRTPAGDLWQMYYLEWEPGRVSRFLSSAHYPTVCLPATGMKLVSETGLWSCPVGGIEIPFATYVFDEEGRDVYVFHAVVEDRPPAAGGTELSYRQVSSGERLESVARGERNLGQRVVGIALRGPRSPSAARAEVAGLLDAVLEISPAAPAPSPLVRR